MTDPGTLARRAQKARERAGLTQEAAARESGVHAITISNIERGVTQRPAAATLARLAATYGVTVSTLLSDDAEDEDSPGADESGGGEDARFLAGIYEGVMWSCERMTAELHSIIRDARLEVRRRRWMPPERVVAREKSGVPAIPDPALAEAEARNRELEQELARALEQERQLQAALEAAASRERPTATEAADAEASPGRRRRRA